MLFNFINDNKEMYFNWLYTISPKQFPRMCDLSSDVLSSYLFVKYPNNIIKFIKGKFDIWNHYWIEVDGKILDFTIIQFLSNEIEMPCFNLSKYEYYQKYFIKYIESPFITKCYYNRYKKYKEIGFSYLQEARKSKNFSRFLNKIENILQ